MLFQLGPDLDGGVPPSLVQAGGGGHTPFPGLDRGYPPSQVWMEGWGNPPPNQPDGGTPPPRPKCEQTPVKPVPSLILRMRAVKIPNLCGTLRVDGQNTKDLPLKHLAHWSHWYELSLWSISLWCRRARDEGNVASHMLHDASVCCK